MKPAGGSYSKKANLKAVQGQATYTSKMMNHTQKMQNTLQGSQYRRMNPLKQANQSRVNSIKVSLQKAQQLGENQYKKAMKHMHLVNSLQKQSRQKQHDSLQIITQEHTFKPKINTKSQLNYLYEGHSLSAEKIHFLKNTGEHDRERNEMKFYDRLMKWGKTHMDKRRDEFIRLQTGRESIEKPQKIVRKPAIFIDIDNMDHSLSTIAKTEQQYTLASSQSFYGTLKKHPGTGTATVRPYINGEQKFYQKQAKAVALKNGETYFYNNSASQRNHIHHDDLNATR